MRIAYIHNVCMHYKATFLKRLNAYDDVEVSGLFGQSHWKSSKFKSIPDVPEIDYRLLPTFDLLLPLRSRNFHLFWNPTLYGQLTQLRPDVMIAGPANFPNNRQVMRYAHKHDIPYIWHGLGSMYSRMTPMRRLAQATGLTQFFRHAAGGLAFNEQSKRYYTATYALDSDSIFVATNVVDTDQVIANRGIFKQQSLQLREQLGLEGQTVVLYVGVIDPSKRLDDLLQAFARLRQDHKRIKLLVVGDGTTATAMRQLSRELGCAADTIFAGRHVDDVDAYYMLGDIFVLPGLGGLAVSHAMTHGLPVIVGPADGTELDLVTPGKNGYLLESTNRVEQIVEYVDRLIRQPELARQMGQSSRDAIGDRFNISTTVATMYRAAVRARNSGP